MSWWKKTPQPVDEPELVKPPDILDEPEPEPELVVPGPEPEPVPAPPEVRSPEPIRMAQPAPGGAHTPYEVIGIWDEDGAVTRIRSFYIGITNHDNSYGPGDVMYLNRLEAAVLGKRYVLMIRNDLIDTTKTN